MELARALNEITGLRTENEALRANLEAVQFQLAQLQRMVFGHKAERLNIDAQSGLLFEVAPPPAPAPQTREVSLAPKQKPVRESLPAHLPREVEIIDLPEEEKPCPCCGGMRHVIGEAVSEKLDYVPATLKVLETRRLKYACRPCEGNLAVAPLPASPIEQGMAAPGLLAHVLVSKFADHLPLNRQEAMLRRAGIELPRSTLCDWVLGAAECLRPLYEHLIGCVRAGDILHSDDTPVPLREKGATVKARAWGWVNPQLRLAAYEFTVSRAGIHPQSFLTGWEGYLIADAYAGYDRLFANPNLREVGCWAHARRKFFDVAKTQKAPGLAHEAVARIAMFYHLDNAWKALPPDERRRRRQEEIGPLLTDFRLWMETHLPGLLPQSPLAKAMGYAANHWAALTRFLDDGRLPLDNNAAERALRPIAVGRKNWLFAGSVRGGLGRRHRAVLRRIGQAARSQSLPLSARCADPPAAGQGRRPRFPPAEPLAASLILLIPASRW
jgi:transposase